MFRALRVCVLACVLLAAAGRAAAQDHESDHDGDHGSAAAPVQFRGLTIQGFSDLTFRTETTTAAGARSTTSTFGLGQLSLFLSAGLAENISIVTETAFKLGSDNRQSQAIELERVYVKYSLSDALKLAFGRTHTALGYWNEAYHHGALLHPTVARPEILRFGGVMPLHAVGLEVTGRAAIGAGWDVSYLGNFANGRSREFSATQGSADMDRSKATALKVSVTHDGDMGTIIFGPMLYRDTIPADPTRAGRESAIRESIPGFHLVIRGKYVELLSEYFGIRHERATTGDVTNHEGWYAIGSARVDGRFKPYAGIDVTKFDAADNYFTGANTSVRRYLGGVRLDVNAYNAVKVEYRREHRAAGDTHAVLFNTAFAF